MEISIDLKLMREIVFKDEALLNEMLTEWIDDSGKKIADIRQRISDENISGVFNKIHEIKTNFSMIHCYTGIQFCEKLIEKIENENSITQTDIDELNQIVESVNKQINNFMEHG